MVSVLSAFTKCEPRIEAEDLLSAMFGYIADLGIMTSCRGQFSMEFSQDVALRAAK